MLLWLDLNVSCVPPLSLRNKIGQLSPLANEFRFFLILTSTGSLCLQTEKKRAP